MREKLRPTKSMVVDDPQYPGQIFACGLLVFLLLGSNEATVRAVKIPGGL